MRFLCGCAAGLLLGLSLVGPSIAAEGAKEPVAASASAFQGAERVLVELPDRAEFTLFTVNDPPRLIADFPDMAWPETPQPVAKPSNLVANVRRGEREAGLGARLVVDLNAPAKVIRAFTENTEKGAQLVLEIEKTSPEAFDALAGWPEEAFPEFLSKPGEMKTPEPGDILVVVDPGHGGADPGAISRGIAEKDLVFDYALALVAAITAHPGFEATLTRFDDEYVSLRDRVDIAHTAGAGVFISLHADALTSGNATGASVYVLSDEASDSQSAALAKAHNRGEMFASVDLNQEESDVARVLFDMARRRTDEKSRELALRLVDHLEKATTVLKDRALQSAGFRVLRAPDIPSVLIELGFMSSEEDRMRLLSPEMREAIVAAIADAIVDWSSRSSP